MFDSTAPASSASPAPDGPMSPPAGFESEVVDSQPRRILVVAEREAAASLRALLMAAFPDALIVIAREFDALWKILTEYDADIVVCGRYPESFDLFAAMRLIRAQAPAAALIVAGGEAGDTLGAELMRRGASDYVPRDCLARLPAVVVREKRHASLQARNDRLVARLRAQERLSTASAKLFELQESERHRLAGELREDIGQGLGAIRMQLARAQPGDSSGAVRDALDTAETLIGRLRAICLGLRPAGLDDSGLVVALRSLAASAHSGPAIELVVDPAQAARRAPPPVEIAAFRIAQEAIGNAVRHAKCSRVAVGVRFDASTLTLSVEDDGVGFDASAGPGRRPVATRHGLSGMGERAAALGGAVELDSVRGRGTRIVATLPMSPADG